MDASHELMTAFSIAGPKIIGRKKWRKLVFAAYRELEDLTPDNGVGPVMDSRREAMTIMRHIMRRCLVARE